MTPKMAVREMEALIIQLISKLEEAEKMLETALKENIAMRKKLAFYENPHTPPSARVLADNIPQEAPKKSKKRGAPEGHKGATRQTKEPRETITVTANVCENCKGPNLQVLSRKEESVIEDLYLFSRGTTYPVVVSQAPHTRFFLGGSRMITRTQCIGSWLRPLPT